MSTTKTNTQGDTQKVVSFKNGLITQNNDGTFTKVEIKNVTKEQLPKKATYFINKQGMSPMNRYKIEALAEGNTVINNTMYPIDDVKEHFEKSQIGKQPKAKAIPMEAKDVTTLDGLLTKYNRATLVKELMKLSIKM